MPCEILGTFPMRRRVAGIQNDPPTAPALGRVYIVGANPTGAWVGNAWRLAIQNDSEWRFICPDIGFRMYDASQSKHLYFTGRGWSEMPPPAITVSATPPSDPKVNDLWVDTEP